MAAEALKLAQEAMAKMDNVEDKLGYVPPRQRAKKEKGVKRGKGVDAKQPLPKVKSPTRKPKKSSRSEAGTSSVARDVVGDGPVAVNPEDPIPLEVGAKRPGGELVKSKLEEKKRRTEGRVLDFDNQMGLDEEVTRTPEVNVRSPFGKGDKGTPRPVSLHKALRLTEADLPSFMPLGVLSVEEAEGGAINHEMVAQSAEVIAARIVGIRESALMSAHLEVERAKKMSLLEDEVKKLTADLASKEVVLGQLTEQVKKAGEEKLALEGKFRNLKKANDGSEQKVNRLEEANKKLATSNENMVLELKQRQTDLDATLAKLKAEETARVGCEKMMVNAAYASFNNALDQVMFCNPQYELDMSDVHPRHVVEGDRLIERKIDGTVRVVRGPSAPSGDGEKTGSVA